MKTIPREVFDKKAVAEGAVRFSDVGYLDVKLEIKKLEISIKLTDFSVFYSQDSLELNGESLQKGKSRVVLDNGVIKKIWEVLIQWKGYPSSHFSGDPQMLPVITSED